MLIKLITEAAPAIVRVRRSPAAITIEFPDRTRWEYVIYDDLVLDKLLRRGRHNVGWLVARLQELCKSPPNKAIKLR